MATYQEKLRDNLSCPVCYETFNYGERLPKGLPCQHTLCLLCLDKYVKKNLEQKYLCPLCQAKFSVLDGGAKSIPNNTSLVGMLELLETKDTTTDGFEQGEDQISTDKKLEIPKCPDHGNAVCIIYCTECHVPLCTKCMTVSKTHNNHTLEDIASMKEMMNTDVDKNVKLFDKIVREFDQFTDETLSMIFKQKSDITARIKEDIDREAERLYTKHKSEVDGHFKDLLQEFNNFTSEFNENKSEFEISLKKYNSNKVYDADANKTVVEIKDKIKCLQSLNAKSPELQLLPKISNTFNIEGLFEQKNAVMTYSVETQTESNQGFSMPESEGATAGYIDEANFDLEKAKEIHDSFTMSSTSKSTNTDELTLTSVPIMIPSGTMDLHLHITNWSAFVKKDLDEDVYGDWWFTKGAVWRVVACFKKPFESEDRFPQDKPVLYLGVEYGKRSKRSKYTATFDILLKNTKNGFWEWHWNGCRNFTPNDHSIFGRDIFSKEWLLSGENPYVRNNTMHICVLLTVE